MSSFDVFYGTYPRKVGRMVAEKAWNKAIKNGAAPEDIIEGARKYAEDRDRRSKDISFTAHPSTWLNQGRWMDDYEVTNAPPPPVDLVARWKDKPNRDYPTAMTLFPHIKKVEFKHRCIYCRNTKPDVYRKVLEEDTV